MKIEKIEDLTDVVASILNIPADKAREYMAAEDGDDQLKNVGKEVFKTKFDEGHRKATKTAAKTVASALKLEFGIDVTGDTPETVVKAFKENHEDADPEELSEKAVKESEVYKSLQSELATTKKEQTKLVKAEVSKQLKDKETEYETRLKEVSKKGLKARLLQEAEEWANEKKAILPTDPVKKRKRLEEIVNKLNGDDIEEDETGDLLFSKADGTPITTAAGHAATIKDRFDEFDYLFDFQVVQQRGSSGLPPKPTKTGATTFEHFKGEVPTDKPGMDKVYMDYASKKIDKKAFDEVKAAYEAQQTT